MYVKIEMCINSDSKWDVEEKENWDKYYPMVANKEMADNYGYFWAVSEAKVIEGSAVPLGSNPATPTLNISETKSTQEKPAERSQEKNEPQITVDDFKEVIKKSLEN